MMSTDMNSSHLVVEDDVDGDDWFFESMKRYRNLHMFDLQYPVKALTWVNAHTICVATRKQVGAEILELNLPEKLLAETPEDEGLTSSRDFHLPSGGLCDRHIADIKCPSKSRLVFCSHELDNSVSVWQLGTESKDVIQEVKILKSISPDECSALMSLDDDHPTRVAFGSTLSNISLVDTEKGENVYNTKGHSESSPLIGLAFQIENMLIACTQQGRLSYLDIRQKPEKNVTIGIKCDPKDCCKAFHVKDNKIAIATMMGMVVLKDLNGSGHVDCFNTGLCSNSGSDVSIQFSPTEENTLSLSGYDQNIYVYSYEKEGTDMAQPLFVHDGHWRADGSSKDVAIWTHSWHPEQSHLLLSSGNDGSLHAWDYVADNS